jgi:hypothetical protein
MRTGSFAPRWRMSAFGKSCYTRCATRQYLGVQERVPTAISMERNLLRSCAGLLPLGEAWASDEAEYYETVPLVQQAEIPLDAWRAARK